MPGTFEALVEDCFAVDEVVGLPPTTLTSYSVTDATEAVDIVAADALLWGFVERWFDPAGSSFSFAAFGFVAQPAGVRVVCAHYSFSTTMDGCRRCVDTGERGRQHSSSSWRRLWRVAELKIDTMLEIPGHEVIALS